ncbi:MAG: hypothetical protein E6J90_27285 [Deltaproteobacteria bacterium]|nr:MAG: hypothetical protein E6J90_27285 [Deltaproteobacteria bacterium]
MSTALSRQVGGVSLATQSQYVIRRKFWSIFERVFRVFTGDGQLIMYIQHPLLKLREEFLVYADEARARPLLRVVSRQVVALNFCYDVADAQTGALLGTVQKRGLRSLVRADGAQRRGEHDEAAAGDAGGALGGQEQGAALLRRLLPLLPSRHAIFVGGEQVAEIRQRFRLFTKEFAVTTRPSPLDPRFVLAVALLALIAEARREDAR